MLYKIQAKNQAMHLHCLIFFKYAREIAGKNLFIPTVRRPCVLHYFILLDVKAIGLVSNIKQKMNEAFKKRNEAAVVNHCENLIH